MKLPSPKILATLAAALSLAAAVFGADFALWLRALAALPAVGWAGVQGVGVARRRLGARKPPRGPLEKIKQAEERRKK